MVTVVSKVKTKRVNHTRPQLFLSNSKARESADSAPLATPVAIFDPVIHAPNFSSLTLRLVTPPIQLR